MNKVSINYKNIYYPPGGILLWIIIFLELFTFGIALIAMVFYSKQEPLLFHDSRLLLNATFGMINTLFLLTSGYFMAVSVAQLKANNRKKSNTYLLLTMLFGMLFLALKSFEYYGKLNEGLDLSYNTFFTFYWLLTLFHVIHVIVGLVILTSVYFGIRKPQSNTSIEDVEASAAFWHMCDLIWIILFPVIYLLF
ncbi:cytochrome c oxidase subunit 3 [Ichthyenterobacterium magnum]|uniref:Nitric oxide reductase NorE protein n=1 Tax=Ichthyenterobacterium magnum TaxID=1230530 RepID=A0A420DVB3_9FLAO|nr:cytochrome c oxidase subunit 3 [Ichthyenterobacterium magnum]RKE98163.1 nitric oxide reductase NorE protein [Ichthyenterobacterium magnum]